MLGTSCAARAAEPVLHLILDPPPADLSLHGPRLIDRAGTRVLEFTSPSQYAELPFARKLDGAPGMTVCAWVNPRRSGEQFFVARGEPVIGANGELYFRPEKDRVTFLLGTDRHGFLLAAAHGNGSMPFPFVTLNEVPINSWSHLAITKDAVGHQRFYVNGVPVASDLDSCWAPAPRPFVDTATGDTTPPAPPLRLQMPQGGLMGEVTVHATALDDAALAREFEARRRAYQPTLAVAPVRLREMAPNPSPHLWARFAGGQPVGDERLTPAAWAAHRKRILVDLPKVIGTPPADVAAYYKQRDFIKPDDYATLAAGLNPRMSSEEDCGTYVRRKVELTVQAGDVMPAWLLVPKALAKRTSGGGRDAGTPRAPAVVCVYGTTAGAGKDTTVGLSGPKPADPPRKNRAFAVDFAEAGFVALAPDLLRDGQRIAPGDKPYNSTRFYAKYPDWSIHAKDAYDLSRALDYLRTLDAVDPGAVGLCGHSYGGHTTIFAAGLEPRAAFAIASGPVSDFLHHGMHWASPRGAGSSQSMPALRPYLLEFYKSRVGSGQSAVRADQQSAIGDWQSAIIQPLPVTFYEFTALVAPRPLIVFQAVGERRPFEEENAAAVTAVYRALGAEEKVRYLWHPGDHDFPPDARRRAVEWVRTASGRQ